MTCAAGGDDVVGEALQADVDDLEVLLEQCLHGVAPFRSEMMAADHAAASAFDDATKTPADLQRRHDGGPVLRVLVGAADVADERDAAALGLRLGLGRADDADQPGGRIGGRAVAEHDVEEHHRRRRVGDLLANARVAQRRVDHRMRSALRELVVAHVDDGVLLALPDVLELSVARRRRVGERRDAGRGVDQLRLEAERAAGEDAAHVALAWRHGPRQRPLIVRWTSFVSAMGLRCRLLALRERHGHVGRLREVRGAMDAVARDRGGIGAEEDHDHRLRAGLGGAEDGRGDVGRGRLRHEHDDLRGRIFVERLQPVQHRDAADRGGEVVPAGAERLRDARAELMDAHGHFLRAGAGCADHADRTASHDVGEAERDAVDDGGAAVRTHHHEVVLLARSASARSSDSGGTLSLNIITSMPSRSAFIASAAA